MGKIARRAALAASFIAAQALTLFALLGPVSNSDWTRGFRAYFNNDQLSYAAIAVNSSGQFASTTEPLTGTGGSFYPSFWYHFLGLISSVTGASVEFLWQVAGLSAIGLAIAILGAIAMSLSRLWFAPLLPALALFTGTLSMVTHDYWFTSLSVHAVIWGPFGSLFTLNAESIGLMAGAVAIALILWHLLRPAHKNHLLLISAAMIGLLANVQTYSFLSTISLVAVFIVVLSLTIRPSRQRTTITILAVALVLALGNVIAAVVGPLPLFGLLLVTGAIAAYPLIRSNLKTALALIALTAIAASPQIIRTLLGIVSGDEFLSYRQESTQDLGVPLVTAALTAIPLILFVIYILLVTRNMPVGKKHLINSFFASVAIGAVIMSTNDLWGFNQEPYRFWLQYSIIAALLTSVLLAYAFTFKQTRIAIGALTLATILWLVALTDFAGFFTYAREQGIIPTQDSKAQSLLQLYEEIPTESTRLILSSQCTDAQLLKLITGAPVATFNYGLAWPTNREEIRNLTQADRMTGTSVIGLQAAHVGYVISDSNCENDWNYSEAGINPIAVAPYDAGVLTLWRVAE